MAAVENHYEFLGLTPSASHEDIAAAIDRVSEQAITLVYTSPQRSSDLWERIRHMRRDLVASPEGRQVYDEALQRSENLAGGGGMPVEEAVSLFRAPEIESAVPVLTERRPPRLAAFARMPEDEQTRGVAWPYALVAAAAVFVIVVGALLARQPGVSSGRRPVAMTLSQIGSSHGSKFVSGGSVLLAWTRVPHATKYRLQIATEAGDPSDAVVFAHGTRTFLVSTPRYHLQVTGPQWYYWRVQAQVAGAWQAYTRSQHFAVARPGAAQPVALAPVTGHARGGKNVRLCWSAVSGAIGYRLRIQGEQTLTVTGTCATLTLRPHTYRWSVAALVRGVHVYTGAYSVAAVVHTRPQHVARRSRAHTTTRRHKIPTVSHTRRHSSSSKRPATSTSVEVAVALPPQTPANQHTSSTASFRTTAAQVSARLRSSPNVARVQHRATAVRATSRPVRNGQSRSVASRSSTSVPRPPSAKKHATPTGIAVPPPPSPPSVPTSTSAPPVPTQIVIASRSSTSSTIEVHPIVSTQTATSAAAGPTSTTPAVRPPSPVPSNTVGSPPTSTPTQSSVHAHPAHPPHPTHPDHPSHP